MTTEELERQISEVKRELSDLKRSVEGLRPVRKSKPGILSIVGSMSECRDFDEAVAYGQYFRKTGRQPPSDWCSGDPIPESAEGS